MTNEEAYNIISEFCFTGYEDNKKPSFKLFGAIHELILDVEENTKLKAEIEQLKSELEQSIKLPCTCDNCKYADFMGVESEHFYCMNHKHYMNVGGYCSFGEKEEPWQTAERTGVK